MKNDIWESEYFGAYDKVMLNSDIYLAVRDFHIRAMKNCKTVLDSGCGTGNVTAQLLKKGYIVYAVDTSKKALEILSEKCQPNIQRLHIYNINAGDLPFEDRMFDGVTSMFVAHFVDDFQNYLREQYRVLKKNGIFALTGRVSGENMEQVIESYENSLRKRGLLPKYAREMNVVRESILNGVSKIVKHKYTAGEVIDLLGRIGFKEIQDVPNPYFGQCYSLIMRKA